MEKLAPGDTAPGFTLPDWAGNTVSLSDFAGSRVVVYFYPAAMTPGCSLEATDFSAAAPAFAEHGLQIVGISPDPIDKLARFRIEAGLENIILLSDTDKSVLHSYVTYGPRMLYGKQIEGVIRSTFLVDVANDGNATVELAQYNVRASGHVDRLRRDLGLSINQ